MKNAKMIRVAMTVILALALLAGCGSDAKTPNESAGQIFDSSRDPWSYTLEEFHAMSEEEQLAFRNSFSSLDDFYAWVDRVQADEGLYPWEKAGAKKPGEYTWEEFEAMSAEHQMAFQKSFESIEDFDAWMQNAQYQMEVQEINPPWLNGGKQPDQYTWEEFEALTAAQQMLFQNTFENPDAFEAWMIRAQGGDVLELPWENGGKQPKDYTWAEFEALSAEQQMAFQSSFDSPDDFEVWFDNAQPVVKMPWENGGKQPKDYTWEEFEALTAEQQMAFQNSFDSIESFDAWLQKAQGSGDSTSIPWENGGKQPDQYTWAEFEALSAELQMIFQNSFENFEEFEAWLERVGP